MDNDEDDIIILSSDTDEDAGNVEVIDLDSSRDDGEFCAHDPGKSALASCAVGGFPLGHPHSDYIPRQPGPCPSVSFLDMQGLRSQIREADDQFEKDTELAIRLSLQESRISWTVDVSPHVGNSQRQNIDASPPLKRAKLCLHRITSIKPEDVKNLAITSIKPQDDKKQAITSIKPQDDKKQAKPVCLSTADTDLSSDEQELEDLEFNSNIFVEPWRQGSPFDPEYSSHGHSGSEEEADTKPNISSTEEAPGGRYMPNLYPQRRLLKAWRKNDALTSCSDEDNYFSDELPDLEPSDFCVKRVKREKVVHIRKKHRKKHKDGNKPKTFLSPEQRNKLSETLKTVLKSQRNTVTSSLSSNRENLFDALKCLKREEEVGNSSCTSSPQTATSSSSPVSTREDRHFTDLFAGSSSVATGDIPTQSVTLSAEDLRKCEAVSEDSDCEESTGVSDSDSSISSEYSESSDYCKKPRYGCRVVRCRTKHSRRTARITQNVVNRRESIESLPEDCRYENDRTLCRYLAVSSMGFHACPKRPESTVDRVVCKFPTFAMHTIEACQEEGGERFQLQAASHIQNFTTLHQEPPNNKLNYLLTEVLMNSRTSLVSNKVYCILKSIQRSHPPSSKVPFSWSDLEVAINRINLPSRRDNVEPSILLSNVLATEYMVSMLEDGLVNAPATSQRAIRKSCAFDLLGDHQFGRVRQVAQWLSLATNFSEFDEITETFLRLNLGEPKNDFVDPRKDVPKVLPMLQRLLELAVVVSNSPDNTAKRIALELLPGYLRATSLHQKWLLVTTIASPLLRLRLVQRLLEDHCGGTSSCSTGSLSLEDLVRCYFCAHPPQNELTPPPTPSDDDGEGGVPHPGQLLFGEESCEELSMLLMIVVESYINSTEGRYDQQTCRRALSALQVGRDASVVKSRLSRCDLHTLRQMPSHVERLQMALTNMSHHELSHKTHGYLLQLQCLSFLAE